jgi:hypothetical protein
MAGPYGGPLLKRLTARAGTAFPAGLSAPTLANFDDYYQMDPDLSISKYGISNYGERPK